MDAFLEVLPALLTLTAMEIVLGIDNVVFIAILAGKLKPEQRAKARHIGLLGAMGIRILMLFMIGWLISLDQPWFELFGHEFAGKDVIVGVGGLFLIAKATHEIHNKLEGTREADAKKRAASSLGMVIAQIMMMDIVFSIDSVLTAVGMVDDPNEHMWVMITAVVVSVVVMLVFAGPVSRFVEKHPTVKMLALSFLLLIGVMLMVEAFDGHINKGYIYSAMGFSLFVEFLNLLARSRSEKRKAIQLRESHVLTDEEIAASQSGDAAASE